MSIKRLHKNFGITKLQFTHLLLCVRMARVPTGALIPRKRPEEGQGHLALSLTLHLILWDRISNEHRVNWRHQAPETSHLYPPQRWVTEAWRANQTFMWVLGI